MKKLAAIILAMAVCMTAVFAADPAEGFWISVDEKTNKDTAGWQLWEQGGKLYGKILSVADLPQDVKATGGKGKSYLRVISLRLSFRSLSSWAMERALSGSFSKNRDSPLSAQSRRPVALRQGPRIKPA